MTQRRTIEFSSTVSAATTSEWFLTDYRFDQNPERAYFGTNTSGGSVTIQVAVSVRDVVPTRIATINTITSATFNGTIHGAWPMIRFINTGGDTGSTVVAVI